MAQDSQDFIRCRSDGNKIEQRIEGFRLSITPIAARAGQGDDDTADHCKAVLTSASGKRLWQTRAPVLSLPLEPLDMNNDGNPDFILGAYSGFVHCCWTYRIISPKSDPAVVATFTSGAEVDFSGRWRNKVVITTSDDVYESFFASYAASAKPEVHLLLEGRTLVDISGEPEFLPHYDENIEGSRKELARQDPEKSWMKQPADEMDEGVRMDIFEIVLSYLYSRRPEQAWKELNDLWPQAEVAKLKADILSARRRGILKYAVPRKSDPPANR